MPRAADAELREQRNNCPPAVSGKNKDKGELYMVSIRKGGHRDLERYYPAMEMDFDSEELLPKLAIHKAMMAGEQELLIVYDDEQQLELGYALVCVKNLYGYVLLKYFAILPWYRDRGVGVQAMRLMNKRYAGRQGIMAELTEFDDPEENHLKKLFKFFARLYHQRHTRASDGQARQGHGRCRPRGAQDNKRLLLPLPAPRVGV